MTASEQLPVVFVHAFPFGTGMWRSQMDAVTGRRLVAPPLPGFDGHPLVAERTMDGYARDVLASLDREGIGRAVFCGLSLGGYVTFGILRQAMARVGGLVLADTRTTIDTPDRLAARVRSIEKARTQGPPAIAEEMIPSVLGATTRATRPDVVSEVRRLIESQPGETIAAGLEAMMTRPDSADIVARVTVPTLIIVGDEDTVSPPSDAESMHRAVRGSKLVTIAGAGHMSNLEAPEEFNAALRDFLRQV